MTAGTEAQSGAARARHTSRKMITSQGQGTRFPLPLFAYLRYLRSRRYGTLSPLLVCANPRKVQPDDPLYADFPCERPAAVFMKEEFYEPGTRDRWRIPRSC